MSDEDIAIKAVVEALDYFMSHSPAPRGSAWKKVMEARNALAVVRSTPVQNPFALGK